MKGSKTRYAILGWLSIRPMSGYDVKRLTEENLGFFWNGSFGQIYPLLHDLEADGHVTVEVQQEGAYPPKKVYSITESGRDILTSWLEDPAYEESFRSELLLKLFFSSEVKPEFTRAKLQHQLEQATELLTQYEHINAKLQEQWNDEMTHRWLILDMGMRIQRALVEWSHSALQVLEDKTHEE